MQKFSNILMNSYLLYAILLAIIFGTAGDLNLTIIRSASIVTLICYALISQYNVTMSKKNVINNDASNFYITGESTKIEYIIITCIYLSAIYALLKITVLS